MRFALLTLLGVALAVHHTQDLVPLKPHKEYIFRFEGDVHSGIPLPTDTRVSRIQAMVHFQVPDDHHAILKLRDVRFATREDNDKERFRPFEDLKERTITKKHIELLELPVRIVYKRGLVSDLMFHQNEETWTSNVKRSVINMLQLNLHKMRRTDEDMMERFELMQNDNHFTTTERTIEGDCEVAYTILRKEERDTEITKTVNFDKCTHRPDLRYNFRYLTECPECKDKEVFEPSTVYNYWLDRDGLKKVEVHSVYTITMQNQPVVKTEVRNRLILEDRREIEREFEWSESRKETLIYSNKVEREIQRFFMYGDDIEMLPYEEVKDKVDTIRRIIEEIKEMKENKHEITHLAARLVGMFRMLTTEELRTVHTTIYMKVDERLKTMMEHALALAGTRNTVTHLLRHYMEMKHMKTYKMVQYLKTIMQTPYPSPKIVDELLRFAETETVKREPVVRQSIWLTIGAVMRGVVGHTMDRNIIREDVRELKERYLNIMMKEYKTADTTYEKILVLKSIANAGIDLSVYELEKIILNKSEELPVRLEAIDALRLLKDMMPRKIQTILMPIYQSRVVEPELRMAALVRIMHTLPQQPLIVQIVSTMEREPNQQVAAFTYDLLHSFVKSTNVCHKKLAAEIRPHLSMTRYKRPERVFTSTYRRLSMFKDEMLTGFNVDFATIFGKNSAWPKEMMMSMDNVFNGMWHRYLFQLGVSQQNIERIIEKVTDKLMRMEKTSHTMVRGRRIRDTLTLLKEIARKLNIRPRVVNDRTPYLMVYLRHKDMDFAVLPLDEKTIDRMLEKFIRDGRLERREIEHYLNREPEFNLHSVNYFYEVIRKVPTTLGVPLIMKSKMPTVMSAEGEFTVEMTEDGWRLRLNTEPHVASTHLIEMRLWNPLFEQGVKLVRSVEARLPIDFHMEMNYRDELEVKYTINVPTERKTVMHMMSRPMTFFRFLSGENWRNREAEQRTIVLPNWRRLNKEKELVYNIWGMKAILRGNWLRDWNMCHFLLGEYDWEFVLTPTHEAPKKIRVFLNTNRLEKVRMEKIDFRNVFEKEFETDITEYENFDERERRDRFHRFVGDMERRDGYMQRVNLKVETESHMRRHGEVEFVTVCDEELRYCKLNVRGKRSPMNDERRDWTFYTTMQLILPKLPKTLKELKEQIHREVQGLVEMKWGAEKMNEINMKIQLEQSKEQKRWLSLVDREHRRLSEQDLLVKAGRLNQLKVVVDYELNPYMRHLIEMMYNYFKGNMFWSSKFHMLNRERNNKIFLKLRVDPMTRTFVDVMLETPMERMEMNDYVIPQVYLPTIAMRPLRELRHEMYMPVCEVRGSKVRTFDDVIYRTPITTCYSVIAKDCSEDPRFVVMVKKLNKDTDRKKVKIINEREQVIELEMVEDKLRVHVDGNKITRDEMEKYNIEMIDDNMVRVKLDDLVVRFDGYDVKVYMGKHMTEKQCGLCGHFDEERDNDFYTPEKEYNENIINFHKSYMLKDECDVDEVLPKENKYHRIENREEDEDEDWTDIFEDEYVPRRRDRTYDDERTYEKERKDRTFDEERTYEREERDRREDEERKYEREDRRKYRDDEEEILEKTHVTEFAHRVCFSLEPVRMCRKNEQMDEMEDKKVRFTCLPRSSHEARELLRKVRRNVVLDLKDYPISFVETVRVPRTCTVY